MSTALFATTRMVALAHALIQRLLPGRDAWLGAVPASGRPKSAPQPRGWPERAAMQHRSGERMRNARSGLAMSKGRTLRVVRVLEVGAPPAHCGRMVISGSMADVCAEIDRLAAREAARA